MGNYVEIPNISPDVVEKNNLNDTKNENKESTFNAKNYLNTRLDKENGETEKTLTIRLLPINLKTSSPFEKVHFHSIHVNKAIFGTEWKSYVCLSKNEDINHETFGNKCPLCELNSHAYKMSEKETDPEKKKELQKLSCSYKSVEACIVRCIERGKENEGVKFWKFNLRDDKADAYNQMMDLYKYRKNKSIEKGDTPENIFDLYKGRDLIVTIKSTKDSNSSVVTIKYDDDITPVTNDNELLREWIYDEKTWQDVFPPKNYDYITLVTEGKYPWFDKEKGKWVDREEFNKNKKNQTGEQENKVEEADKKLKSETNTPKETNLASSIEIDDEDDGEELPF